jgi:hypothetical protein
VSALQGALLAAAALPSCLIPEPDANHTVSDAHSSVPIFSEEPGPAAEPDLGSPPTPAPVAAPAQTAAEPAAAAAHQSSTSSQTETPSEATPSATQAGAAASAPEQQQPAAQTESPSEPKPELPAQDPSPPDLPTEPTTAEADNANPPALATAPKEVLELLDRYYLAFSTGQWEVARQCFWDGATFTSVRPPAPGEPVQVMIRPAREVFDEFVSGKRMLEAVDGHLAGKPQVLRTGDVSHAWCRYEAKYGTPTDAMSWRRIDSVTLVMHEDVWKIAHLVQSRSVDLP